MTILGPPSQDLQDAAAGGSGSSGGGFGGFIADNLGPLVGLAALGLGVSQGRKDREQYNQPRGYQGEIPDYEFVREQVQDTFMPDRRPGSRGQRYFSDYQYVPPDQAAQTRQTAFDQALDLRKENLARAGQPFFDPVKTEPSGIQTIVPGLDYSSRDPAPGVDRSGSTPTSYIGISGRQYSAEDITDVNQFQFYPDGTAYAPGYGFLNLNIADELMNYAAVVNPDALSATGTPPTGDETTPEGETPPTEDEGGTPPEGDETPPADLVQDQFGLSSNDARSVLDNMIFGFTAASPADFPDIKVGSGDWRRIAQLLDYKDANGRLITPDGYVASMNDTYKFSFDVGTGEKDFYTPVEFRSGDRKLSAEQRGAVEQAARDVVGGATAIPESMAQSTSQLEYLNYILSLAGKKFTPKETAKAGGLMALRGGGYLDGATDGMADMINASIEGEQPAALSDGEFVVPADVVSHLGNGNSDAGADVLYGMMANIRKARTGNTKQGTQIDPNQFMPKQKGMA